MDFKKPFKTLLRHMTEARLDEFALGKSLNIYGEAAEQANSFFALLALLFLLNEQLLIAFKLLVFIVYLFGFESKSCGKSCFFSGKVYFQPAYLATEESRFMGFHKGRRPRRA